jgi:hypothetical protein
MQYLLMCCFEETRWAALPDAERGRIMDDRFQARAPKACGNPQEWLDKDRGL